MLSDDDWLPVALGDPLMLEAAADELSMIDAVQPAGLGWGDVILRLDDEQRVVAATADGLLPAAAGATHAARARCASPRRRCSDSRCAARSIGTDDERHVRAGGDPARRRDVGDHRPVPRRGPHRHRRRPPAGLLVVPPDRRGRTSPIVSPASGAPLGVKVTVRRLATTLQVSISSRLLASWFERRARHRHRRLRPPDPRRRRGRRPRRQRRALLRGLWTGDGSWSLVAGGPSVVLEYGTVSRELADGMVRLLACPRCRRPSSRSGEPRRARSTRTGS